MIYLLTVYRFYPISRLSDDIIYADPLAWACPCPTRIYKLVRVARRITVRVQVKRELQDTGVGRVLCHWGRIHIYLHNMYVNKVTLSRNIALSVHMWAICITYMPDIWVCVRVMSALMVLNVLSISVWTSCKPFWDWMRMSVWSATSATRSSTSRPRSYKLS